MIDLIVFENPAWYANCALNTIVGLLSKTLKIDQQLVSTMVSVLEMTLNYFFFIDIAV